MLSFEYVKEGYSFCVITDVKEAELILSTSKAADKIIFYYNDFLGDSFARFMDGIGVDNYEVVEQSIIVRVEYSSFIKSLTDQPISDTKQTMLIRRIN